MRPRHCRLVLVGTVFTLGLALSPAAQAADLWVDGNATTCADVRSAAEVSDPGRPWCTLQRAATQARAGDVIRVAPATYRGTVRFDRSGTADAPIRIDAAAPGVILDANGAPQALKLMDVSDLVVSGLRVTGGTAQGIWVQGGERVRLTGVEVTGSAGSGLSVRGAVGLALQGSTVTANASAGIIELAGTRDARYVNNVVTDNGLGVASYNGDGIQLGGVGAVVADSMVARNGSSTYEHGIYTGAASSGWRLERNVVRNNAGANVKAAGGPGVVRRNHMTGGRFGLVLADNPVAVTVETNLLDGWAQHLVLLTAGARAARARLLANTIVQAGRSTASGDASALFVVAADELELRNNVIAYAGADGFGISVWVNDPSRLHAFSSDSNWFCARDSRSRHLAWAGSRTTLTGWRTATGHDARTQSSWPPAVDSDGRITSTNWGRGRGRALGLAEDYLGQPLPAFGPVDVGARQEPPPAGV